MFKNLLTATFVLASITLCAQNPSLCSGQPAIGLVDGNNLYCSGIGFGTLGQLVNFPLMAGYDGDTQPPAGTILSDLWVGGIDANGNLGLVNENAGLPYWDGFGPGPLDASGGVDPFNCEHWNRIWSVARFEIETHRADLADNGQLDAPLAGIVGWPGAGNPHFFAMNGFPLPAGSMLAPFVDHNNDGIYNAYDGDYPHPDGLAANVGVAKMTWAAYNSGISFLAMDFHTTTWSLACDDNDVLNNTVFQTFHLTNRGMAPLDSVVLGWRELLALGSYEDDYIGTDPGLHSTFIYNADNTDGPLDPYNYGENPPACAFTVLNHPLYKSMYYYGSGAAPAAMQAPQTPAEIYHYLNGHWRDNTPLTEGGTGYEPGIPGAQSADFAFTGDPAAAGSWAMTNVSTPTGLLRLVTSIYLGTIPAGESRQIVTAWSFHRGEGLDHLENVSYLTGRVAQLRQQYDNQFEDACSTDLCTDDCVWPGDANRDGVVNHADLLPLGVAWGETGPERGGFLNWGPHTAPDWGQTFNQSHDFKHLDPNGDGAADFKDVQLIRSFYGNAVPGWSTPADVYPPGNDLGWRITPGSIDTNNILPNQLVIVSAMFDSLMPVRGGALEWEFDTAYWTVMSVPLPSDTFSTFKAIVKRTGETEIALSRIRIDAGGVFSDGSWGSALFRAKAIAPTQSNTTYMYFKNIEGMAPDGAPLALGAYRKRFVFAGGVSGNDEAPPVGLLDIFPNPAHGAVRLSAPGQSPLEARFFDAAGRLLAIAPMNGAEQAELNVGHLPRGLVFVQVRTAEGIFVERLMLY